MKKGLVFKFLSIFSVLLLIAFLVFYIFYKPIYVAKFLKEKSLQTLNSKK